VRHWNSRVVTSTALLTRLTTSSNGASWVLGTLEFTGTPERGTRCCWDFILWNFSFCKKGFEKSFSTDGAKLLEHSFPRMTWRIMICRFVGLLVMMLVYRLN
jgi:hypothetical protein